MPRQIAGLFAQLVLVAASDDEDLHVGEPRDEFRQRGEQHRHALARFVVPPQEQHGASLARVPVEQRGVGERRDVDTVGDLHGVGAQRLHLPAAREVRHRDAADDLLVIGPQDALKDAERQRLRGRRVERRDDGPFCGLQCEHRQARRVRLVDVQHVEVALGDPLLDLAVRGRPEPQPRHRAVVRDRHGLAPGHHVVRQLHVRRGRREHAHLVPGVAQHLGELEHVGLHATRHVERIGADHPDTHVRFPTVRGARRTDRRSTAAAACASRRDRSRCWRRTGRRAPA